MKRALSIVICGALALSGVIFGVGAYNGEAVHDEDVPGMEMIIKDMSDLRTRRETDEERMSRLRAEYGDELAEEIDSAGPDSCIYTNLVDGTVEVVTFDPSYPEVTSTEPYIPEGREVAEMPIVEMGARDMSQIHVPSVDQFPYCTNAYLEVTYADGSHYVGSGVFVRDRILLTAGHMLKNPERGKAVHIDVAPGGIYSSFETVPVNGMMIPNKRQDNYDQGYDYGIISIGKSLDTGYLGMLIKTDTQLKNMSLVGVYGYPGTSGITQGTLWYSSGKVIATDPQMFTFTATTGGGFSGGS